jgi:hypothetical protein
MVNNTRNYRLSGLRPSSGILNTIEHVVSKTGSVSAKWLRLARSKGPNWVGVFPPANLKTETYPVSEKVCSLVFRILNDGQSPKT